MVITAIRFRFHLVNFIKCLFLMGLMVRVNGSLWYALTACKVTKIPPPLQGFQKKVAPAGAHFFSPDMGLRLSG